MTTSPADSSLVKEGDLLAGKYRVERVLGIGGMGVVVAAMHVDLEQRVALKFLLPELSQNAEAVERFLREARAAVRLKGDHVARVLDVGKLETGAPYIVMEYLEGFDLAKVIETQRPTIDQSMEYMLQTCEAIAEAHSLGIVHRDLKPQNLFLTKRVHGAPLIKVLDFGISKAVTPGARPDMVLTKTGIVMGSPLYMSPEQMKSGRLVDHRSDLWALGVILYQLLTGLMPFEAETVPHLCAMIMTEQPRDVRTIRPEIPADLAMVVAHCLEKDPNKRYQNVAELAAALEPFAPKSARGATGRISTVLNVPQMIETSSAPTEPGPRDDVGVGQAATVMSAAHVAQSRTATAWGESQTTNARKLSGQKWLFVAGGAGALLVALIVLLTRGSSPSAPTTPSSTPAAQGAVAASLAPTAKNPGTAPLAPAVTPSSGVSDAGFVGSPPAETASPTPSVAPPKATAKPTSTNKPPPKSSAPPAKTNAPPKTGGADLFGDPQ